MKLSEVGSTISNIDLGRIDAESDYKLAADFVRTPYVEIALSGPKTLLLGRKGSGKSAIFTQLPTLVSGAGVQTQVLQLTPDQYAWAALKQYEEQGLLPEHAHTNAWKLTLAIEVAAHLSAMDFTWSGKAKDAVERLRQFVEENFGELQPGLATTARGLLRGLRSFNLGAFGFSAGYEREAPANHPITPAVINALMESLTPALDEAGVLVAFDRLDDSWDGSDEAKTLLVGLLKAAKEMNDAFGLRGGVGLRVLIFLRTDIYEALRFDDKDKHRATEAHLLWDSETLHEMLTRRLPDEVTADELFEEGEMRGRITPFNYIVKRTFLRPREALQFVGLCLDNSDPAGTEISKSAIREAESQYSSWKVDDLKQEFAKVAPQIDGLLEALRQEVHRYDSLDELIDLLGRKAPGVMQEIGGRRSMELLFSASAIGIRLRGAGSTRFKSEDPLLALPNEGAVYVHQGLHKGLNIVEARRPTDSPTEEDQAISDDGRGFDTGLT